jgi:signal transduction histidine kinase
MIEVIGRSTRWKKFNADLKEQNRKLRELAEHRSASIAHLAHELRTPLTSIIGFSEILLTQEELTDAQRNFCERIQNSAHQLQNSLVQLGELARLENLPKMIRLSSDLFRYAGVSPALVSVGACHKSESWAKFHLLIHTGLQPGD